MNACHKLPKALQLRHRATPQHAIDPACLSFCCLPAPPRPHRSSAGTNEYQATHGVDRAHYNVEQMKTHVPGEPAAQVV
jgi:hypothetical protein